MLDFDEALEKILKHTKRLPAVKISIAESLGRVLAKEIKTREPIPRFDSSSVDGFAVRREDINEASKENPVRLRLQGTRQAGTSRPLSLKPGRTMKIMTGALLPKNTRAIVMKEHVAIDGGIAEFTLPAKEGENVRRKGEEFTRGEIVLSRGTIITPPVVGMLATLGFASIKAYRVPRVALIVTGNELRTPSGTLRAGEIRDSNSYALAAALRAVGISPTLVLHVPDSREQISRAFARALKKGDVVVSAGGVSVGDFDFVKEVLNDLRVKTVFWRVAMKPGKPNYFGTRGARLVFGLPGNPVSALVSFEMLVMPALRKMMGIHSSEILNSSATLESDVRKGAGRIEFVRAIASRSSDGHLTVRPVEGQGSHMVGGLAVANCLIKFPKESELINKGEVVAIRMLSWNVV
jgi:molybdopterin molybdotransferase